MMEKRNVVDEKRTPPVSVKNDPPPSEEGEKQAEVKPKGIQNVEELARLHK